MKSYTWINLVNMTYLTDDLTNWSD